MREKCQNMTTLSHQNPVVSLQQKSSNNLTLSAPLKAGKDSQRFKLPARHGLKLCQTQGVVTSQIKRLPGCQRALQNNGSSIQGMLEIWEISCPHLGQMKLQAGRSNDLKTYKIIIFGIRLLDVVSCNHLFLQHQVQPLKQLDMTKVTTLRHTKGKVPSNIFTKLSKQNPTKQHCQLCVFFTSVAVSNISITCRQLLFFRIFLNHPPLHHSCCSNSWIDPAVPNVSRYKYALNTTDCFTAIFGLVGLQGKNLNVWSKKSTKYIESCFGDLPKSPRMGKGERLCFHATCTSRL